MSLSENTQENILVFSNMRWETIPSHTEESMHSEHWYCLAPSFLCMFAPTDDLFQASCQSSVPISVISQGECRKGEDTITDWPRPWVPNKKSSPRKNMWRPSLCPGLPLRHQVWSDWGSLCHYSVLSLKRLLSSDDIGKKINIKIGIEPRN